MSRNLISIFGYSENQWLRRVILGELKADKNMTMKNRAEPEASIPWFHRAKNIVHFSDVIQKRILAGSLVICSLFVGITSGYYTYAGDITSGEPFLIVLWYVLLPVGALAASWPNGKFDLPSATILTAPVISIVGFWLTYRHPDLWHAAIFAALESVALCVAAFIAGRLFLRRKPNWIKKDKYFRLSVSALAATYALIALVLCFIPLEVNYVPKALSYRGEGIINDASTDTDVISGNTMFFVDQALYGDLMAHLKDGGYSQIPNSFASGARKDLKGPLLSVLPLRDHGIPGT